MWFEVGNRIVVREPVGRAFDWCRKNLVLANPEYHKKERMGLWLGNTPQNIYLYERNGDRLVIPFGCISELKREFPMCSYKAAIKPPEPFNYHSDIRLYPYQEKAMEAALEALNGVLVMPCGAGKTQTALEVVSRLGVKTLWLTHTQDLLNQSMNRAKSVLNCEIGSYGTITGGKVNIGTGLTFATVQTMSRLDLAQYRDTWGCIIVDECHKAVGSPTKVMQFYKVLSNLSCRYKFGLTATPKRSDGLERSMFALIGEIIHEVSREEVADTICPVRVRNVQTGYVPDLNMALAGDGTINYAGLVDDLIRNKERFSCVAEVLNTLDGPAIVLGSRVEYLERLNRQYPKRSICLSGMGAGKAAKAERKEALRRLNSGELDCIFATYQLAKEGLDVPNLRYVVFATPEKDETTVTQAAGRVGRKAEGKEFGTIIDFIDTFGMYQGWAKKRRGYYIKLGYSMLT